MPKDAQHVQFLNNYYNTLADPNTLTKTTQEIADDCNLAHLPPTTQGVDGVDSQIVGRHMSECRRRAANQARAERNTPEQTQILEAAYALNHYPPPGTRMILMWQTGLSYRKIKNWFEQKAKMLKRAGGGPTGPNPRSSRHATRMWKAYDADREGYVRKLLNGSICPMTGADLTQRMRNNLPNAHVNGAMNNMNGHLGLGLMAPGANIGFGLNYQNGPGSFQAMQALSHNLMSQHGQARFQNVPAPPHNQMIPHGQNGSRNMQAPLPNQVNQQARQGSQQMPMYTQAQSQMYSMPPAQFMNLGNNGLTAGQSYPANGNQQAGQQIAQPGANILNPDMRNSRPALFNGINKAGWSSIPSGRPAAQNYHTPRGSQGQRQKLYAPPYPQAPASQTERPLNGGLIQPATSSRKRKPAPVENEVDSAQHSRKRPRHVLKSPAIASSAKRKFTPADGEIDNTEHPNKQHKSMRRVSRTKGQMKPKPSPEFLAQLTNIAEGVYQGHTFMAPMAPNTGISFNNGGMNRWSPNQSPTRNNGYGRHYDGKTTGARETTPAISTPTILTPDIDPTLLDPRLFNDNKSTSGKPHATANQDPTTFDPQQQFAQEAQKEDNSAVQGKVQSPTPHNARSQGGIWETKPPAQYTPPPKNSPYQQDGAQELESQGQVPSPLEYPVNAQDVDNFDNSLPPMDRSAFLGSIPMDGGFDFDSFLTI
ncbi:hypothetical protein OCU04_000763 [Sclerotinia nivalis]|uniref:Homeobox domain-containing protein n=1 Tax=Sclerotinia nivalis TaxID=352851 RepID=A0A9X0AWR6_9HELO|nr:hypothetical protein OCU04_000763 [Sclerotinia nivalis]